MSKTKRVKSNALGPVPQSQEECRSYIRRIGEHQRERDRITADMNDQIGTLQEYYAGKAAPHNEAILELTRGVQAYAEAHRDELTNGGKRKSADLGTGEIQWRLRPPSVRLQNITGVIEALKQLKLTRFIRTKEEINKEAILAEPETVEHIKGITINQGEDFVIKPSETELEEVA